MNYRIIPVTAFSQNCSLIWCEQTRLAALVDPGGDAEKIKQEVDASGLTLMQILLTHGSGCKACLRKVVCLGWKSASR